MSFTWQDAILLFMTILGALGYVGYKVYRDRLVAESDRKEKGKVIP